MKMKPGRCYRCNAVEVMATKNSLSSYEFYKIQFNELVVCTALVPVRWHQPESFYTETYAKVLTADGVVLYLEERTDAFVEVKTSQP